MSIYFESHVTIDPVFGEERDRARITAERHGFQLAKLFMDKGVENQKDTFMTGHSLVYADIETRTRHLVEDLKDAAFKVRRYKIEDTLLDSRFEDAMNLL